MLKYPAWLLPHLQAPVDAALVRAELRLNETMRNFPSKRSTSDRLVARVECAEVFTVDVFTVFARQACEAGRQRRSIQRIREDVDQFLESELIPHAFRVAHLNDYYPPGPRETLQQVVCNRVHVQLWQEFLKELQEVADEIAAAPSTLQEPVTVADGLNDRSREVSADAPSAPATAVEPSPQGASSETSEKTAAPSTSLKATDSETMTIKWRREQVHSYAGRRSVVPEARFLAAHFGITTHVYHALIRGDDSRYGPSTKRDFLEQLGVSETEWDLQR